MLSQATPTYMESRRPLARLASIASLGTLPTLSAVPPIANIRGPHVNAGYLELLAVAPIDEWCTIAPVANITDIASLADLAPLAKIP